MLFRTSVIAALVTGLAGMAAAAPCDYRLSSLLGRITSGERDAATGETAAGSAARTVGNYTLTHLSNGASGAGLIAGAANGIGAAASALSAPVVLGTGAALAVGAGAMEGVCYFRDERITDPQVIHGILQSIDVSVPEEDLSIDMPGGDLDLATVQLRAPDGRLRNYELRRLYIVNGVLKYDDWGRNTVVGDVAFVMPRTGPAPEASPEAAPETAD